MSTRYPNVGESVTFNWVVSDEGSDPLSCSLEIYNPNKGVWEKNAIDDCIATTSFNYPIEAFSTTRSVALRVTDGKFTTSRGTSIIPKAVAPAPILETLSVTEGTYLGDTKVVITGENFVDVSNVTFSGTKAEFTVDSETRISLVTPRYYSARAANVMVTTTQGGQSNTLKYTFFYAPRVYSVTPAEGSVAGGTEVVLSGHYFTNVSKVMFGEIEAQSFTVDNSRQITAVSPAGQEGAVQVVVETPGGTSENYKRYFTYKVPPPVISSMSPTKGPEAGGTVVTLTGSNFIDVSSISFGGVEAPKFTVADDTSIIVESPANSTGKVDVTVISEHGQSNEVTFTYSSSNTPPQVERFSASPSVSIVNQEIVFAWEVDDVDGGALICKLNTGNENGEQIVACGASFKYTYATTGTYVATLTVIDSKGESDSKTLSVEVVDAPDTVAFDSPSARQAWQEVMSIPGIDYYSLDLNTSEALIEASGNNLVFLVPSRSEHRFLHAAVQQGEVPLCKRLFL